MIIEHTVSTRSHTILSDQNSCLLTYTIMEEVLCSIKMIELAYFVRSFVILLDHMIEDRPYKWPCLLRGVSEHPITGADAILHHPGYLNNIETW